MIASNGHFCGARPGRRVRVRRSLLATPTLAAGARPTAPEFAGPKQQCGQETCLDANAAADAQLLGQEGNLAGRRDLNTQLACTRGARTASAPTESLGRAAHEAAEPRRRGGGGWGAPILTTGQLFLHSCLHFLGLHRSPEMTAMRVSFSSPEPSSLAFSLGAMARRGSGCLCTRRPAPPCPPTRSERPARSPPGAKPSPATEADTRGSERNGKGGSAAACHVTPVRHRSLRALAAGLVSHSGARARPALATAIGHMPPVRVRPLLGAPGVRCACQPPLPDAGVAPQDDGGPPSDPGDWLPAMLREQFFVNCPAHPSTVVNIFSLATKKALCPSCAGRHPPSTILQARHDARPVPSGRLGAMRVRGRTGAPGNHRCQMSPPGWPAAGRRALFRVSHGGRQLTRPVCAWRRADSAVVVPRGGQSLRPGQAGGHERRAGAPPHVCPPARWGAQPVPT